MSFIDRLLHAGEGRTLKRLARIADQVNSIEDDYVAMTDEELRGQTADFRERLDNGASLDDLLPEAFATVREATKRASVPSMSRSWAARPCTRAMLPR